MKVYDIISEDEEVAEAPVGMLKRAGQKIAGTVSQAAAGKSETSKEANQVFKDLKIQTSRGELDLNNMPVEKFKSFMQKKGYDDNLDQQIEKWTDSSDPESTLNKKQIEKIVLAQTQSAAYDNTRVQKGKFAKGSASDDKSDSKKKATSAELKKVADAVSKMSDAEKQELAKLI